MGGGGWSWVEVEMNWVEVDGAGWSWVHGLVIPKSKIGYEQINVAKIIEEVEALFWTFVISCIVMLLWR